jgi:FixJ family two-component response regulator
MVVAIIDDDHEVNASLRWLIESIGYQVKTFSRVEPFLKDVTSEQPNCLILDVRMPTISGFELYEILKTRKITIPTIFITGHGDIPMAVQAMKEGAINFLTKPVNNQILLETINKAVRQDIQRKQEEEKAAQIFARVKRLTPREYEVMGLMVSGTLTKKIAERLGISLSTAELHRANVMKKMQVTSFAELVSYAVKYEFVVAD